LPPRSLESMRSVFDSLKGGFSPDQIAYNLPDGYFNDGRNVRFRDGTAEKTKGTAAVFGSLSATAIWAKYVTDGNNNFFAYGNEAIVYATDGATHANISSASYNAPLNTGYTGGAFNGFLILNDTALAPQQWTPSLLNKIQPLSNWPGSTFCKVIRPFREFLVAMRVTQSSTYNPRLMRWSDAAPFGALPGSWDYTDPTNQAGIKEFGESPDELIDCLPLRDVNVVYKQFNTWLMQYIGGPDIFAFRQLFSQSGMLTEDCAAAFGTNHLVVTDSDIIVHDGSSAQSIGKQRTRRWLFSTLNTQRYQRMFVRASNRDKLIYICFPESGHDFPNLALVWDWANDDFFVKDLGANMACSEEGIITGSESTFAGLSGSFASQVGIFDEPAYTPFSQRLVLFNSGSPQALQAETGETLNGATMTAYVERANIGLTRDVGSIKRVRRVFPKIVGTAGDVLKVYIGARTAIDGNVTYHGPYNFTIGTDYKIDCRVSARWVSLRFETMVTNSWRLAGFDVEFDADGQR
jgi:hypothetical protein